MDNPFQLGFASLIGYLSHKAIMDTGARLKLVRESYKLSQRELARRSGVTNATISLIEQNRVSPSISSLKKLLEGIPDRKSVV